MKQKTFFLFLVASFGLLASFKIADDILSRLGLQQEYAQKMILNNLVGNFSNGPMDNVQEDGATNDVYQQTKFFQLPYIPRPKLTTLLNGDKTGAAKELCGYIKRYLNSNEFITRYNTARESAKPTSEPYRMDAATIESMQNGVKEQEKSIADMKKNKTISASIIAQMEKSVADQKRYLAEQSDPTPNKTKWEKMYPADPAITVKARLQEYLNVAATVDFAAKLTVPDKYGKVKFVNPDYEKKSLKWKAIFRSGKEVTDTVTSFVKEWLKGEIISIEKTSMSDAQTSNTTGKSVTNSNKNENTTPNASPEKQGKPRLKDKLKSIIKN
ncbi:MAG TPA: hypothetical protein PLU37_05555 [Chitinophagaceae bacterium]|nr:hypothetical protein [Chitinophagaceae bacterium]HPG10976.1 hypothetical protein [Chitinophagaceae bacterium]HRX94003.1 hypothetical protein [Chitinophagaceae bacterium]